MKLTSDTITDSQIRELRNWALTRFTTMVPVSQGHWISAEECIRLCDDAVEELLDACARYPMPACACCGEIINARSRT